MHIAGVVAGSIVIAFALVACGGGSPPMDAAPGDAATGSDVAPQVDAAPEAATSADTWDGFAQGFFASYCVSCHGPTTPDTSRDYSQLAQVQRDAALIRCGVTAVALSDCAGTGISPRQFPIGTGPHPSDADRARIVAWIAAGAM